MNGVRTVGRSVRISAGGTRRMNRAIPRTAHFAQRGRRVARIDTGQPGAYRQRPQLRTQYRLDNAHRRTTAVVSVCKLQARTCQDACALWRGSRGIARRHSACFAIRKHQLVSTTSRRLGKQVTCFELPQLECACACVWQSEGARRGWDQRSGRAQVRLLALDRRRWAQLTERDTHRGTAYCEAGKTRMATV